MMKPDPYSLTELIQNDDFIAWVLRPNAGNEARWQRFMSEHPEKKQTVEHAIGYVILLAEDTGRHTPSPEQSKRMWGVIASHIQPEYKHGFTRILPAGSGRRVVSWLTLLFSLSLLGYWYYTHYAFLTGS